MRDPDRIHLKKGRVTAYIRNGLGWTTRVVAVSLDILVEPADFDGEVIVVQDGRTNFSELQAALAAMRASTCRQKPDTGPPGSYVHFYTLLPERLSSSHDNLSGRGPRGYEESADNTGR